MLLSVRRMGLSLLMASLLAACGAPRMTANPSLTLLSRDLSLNSPGIEAVGGQVESKHCMHAAGPILPVVLWGDTAVRVQVDCEYPEWRSQPAQRSAVT